MLQPPMRLPLCLGRVYGELECQTLLCVGGWMAGRYEVIMYSVREIRYTEVAAVGPSGLVPRLCSARGVCVEVS